MKSTLNYITTCALKALLYEVSASPKPGLVDRYGSGAHQDMDYFTFVDSALSLEETFFDCAYTGAHFDGDSLKDLFSALRPIGIRGEMKMYAATEGVNTHKGAIFSLGILCAAAGYALRNMEGRSSAFNIKDLCNLTKEMTEGLTDELKQVHQNAPNDDPRPLTSGEKLYAEKGVLGIRGEVASGFASVTTFGLPALKKLTLERKYSKNDIMVQILIELLAHVEDTNVLARYGEEGLEVVRAYTHKALQRGGVTTADGWKIIKEMDQVFVEKNISPGGTADLLAVTLMLHFLSGDGQL